MINWALIASADRPAQNEIAVRLDREYNFKTESDIDPVMKMVGNMSAL